MLLVVCAYCYGLRCSLFCFGDKRIHKCGQQLFDTVLLSLYRAASNSAMAIAVLAMIVADGCDDMTLDRHNRAYRLQLAVGYLYNHADWHKFLY